MNSEGTSIAPINLKVKSCDSNLEKDEATFAKHDIATHLKEMEQVVNCSIGNSMFFGLYIVYVLTILLLTCHRASLKKNMTS